jgi:hypothetical protein
LTPNNPKTIVIHLASILSIYTEQHRQRKCKRNHQLPRSRQRDPLLAILRPARPNQSDYSGTNKRSQSHCTAGPASEAKFLASQSSDMDILANFQKQEN